MNISVIIVNYNTTNFVENCIKSIKNHSAGNEYEIIVVDNNSTDKSLNSLENIFEDVKFYYKSENDGFGAGCNFGAEKSLGKYLFFLNPDVCLISNIMNVFYNFMEGNLNSGVCSALIMGMNQEYQYCFNSFPSIGWEILEATGYFSNKKIKKIIGKVKIRGENGLASEIDWAIGACLFVRREVFAKVNGFNENYFLYYEDTDLQKRIKEAGYEVVILGNQTVKHFGKSSIENSEKGSNIYYTNMHNSKLLYYKLHNGLISNLLVRFVNVAAYIIRIVILPFREFNRDLKREKYKNLKNILKIYFSFSNAR